MLSVAQPAAGVGSKSRSAALGRTLATVAAGLGLVAAIAVIRASGARQVASLILHTGWWLPLVIALHLPQTLCSALGWGALLDRARRPAPSRLYLFRWIRESVNSLLPVAQIGGEVVRARLLARQVDPGGGGLAWAGASCALDVTLEIAAQIVFTLLGVALLALMLPHSPVLRVGMVAVLGLAALAGGLFAALRLGRSDWLRTRWARLARRLGRAALSPPSPRAPFRADAGQQAEGFLWHLASWMLGVVETLAGLHALQLPIGLRGAVVVESLGQVVRTAAFAVPGAIGVQEGGFVLICGLFGVAPPAAVALSLIRRLREVALGAPGLVAWRFAERGTPA